MLHLQSQFFGKDRDDIVDWKVFKCFGQQVSVVAAFVRYFLLENINISFAQRLMSVASKRLEMLLQSCLFHV